VDPNNAAIQPHLSAAFFDCLLVIHGLELAEAQRPFLRELWRVLTAAGRLIIVAPNRTSLWAQFETSPHFDDQERSVLRYAKEATESGVVSDATWNALHGFFDTRQAMEVVLTVAWYNCVVRILLPLQIEHEPGFKRN